MNHDSTAAGVTPHCKPAKAEQLVEVIDLGHVLPGIADEDGRGQLPGGASHAGVHDSPAWGGVGSSRVTTPIARSKRGGPSRSASSGRAGNTRSVRSEYVNPYARPFSPVISASACSCSSAKPLPSRAFRKTARRSSRLGRRNSNSLPLADAEPGQSRSIGWCEDCYSSEREGKKGTEMRRTGRRDESDPARAYRSREHLKCFVDRYPSPGS